MNGTNELSAALAAVTADAVDELLAGYVGRNVLIRTVTMYHLGRVEAVTAKFVRLYPAWAALVDADGALTEAGRAIEGALG